MRADVGRVLAATGRTVLGRARMRDVHIRLRASILRSESSPDARDGAVTSDEEPSEPDG
jgi:hypothetical protein